MFTTTVGVLRIDRVELREELEQAWWYRCRIAHTVNRNPNTQVHNSRILWVRMPQKLKVKLSSVSW